MFHYICQPANECKVTEWIDDEKIWLFKSPTSPKIHRNYNAVGLKLQKLKNIKPTSVVRKFYAKHQQFVI